MLDEYDYFEINSFTRDLLNVFINHGYGNMKMYEATCFSCNLSSDETACLTIKEFYEKSHMIGEDNEF